MNEVYKTSSDLKKEKITEILKAAIKKLNKIKGTNLKLYEANFGLGVDHMVKTDGLVILTTAVIQNPKTKGTIKLLYPESFFDASIPNPKDAEAGVDKAKTDEDKVLVRVAYSIWFNCKWHLR